MKAYSLGIDVGSTTVKVVALDEQRAVLGWRYVRSNADVPVRALLQHPCPVTFLNGRRAP